MSKQDEWDAIGRQAEAICMKPTKESELKEKIKEDMRRLRAQMKPFLDNTPCDNELDRLQKQATVLDQLISMMLLNVTKLDPESALTQYGLALRAQSQYRQTVQVVNRLQRQREQDHTKNNPDNNNQDVR